MDLLIYCTINFKNLLIFNINNFGKIVMFLKTCLDDFIFRKIYNLSI